jgi:release factor glutamine methyltransferase
MGDEVPAGVLDRFTPLLERRLAGTPISYIRGIKEFYGYEFVVNPAVLVPRPETELLVDEVLRIIELFNAPLHVHDCCTGSGAVAIAIAAEASRRGSADLTVTASDISTHALAVAENNAKRLLPHSRPLLMAKSDLLTGLDEPPLSQIPRPLVITANPPYLTTKEYEVLSSAGWPEPRLALVSGHSGLDHLTTLSRQAFEYLLPSGWFISEIGAGQGESAIELLSLAGFTDCTLGEDLAGKTRICRGYKRA